MPERIDGAVDQIGAVVGGYEFHPGWKTRLHSFELVLHILKDLPNVLAVTHHDRPTGHFAFAIQFGDAAPHIGPEFDARDITYSDWCSLVDGHREILDIREGLNVSAPANQIFLAGHLQAACTDFVVAVADCVHDLHQRNLVGQQPIRIDVHLVLLHEAADGRDL